jgi:hypothetical protein
MGIINDNRYNNPWVIRQEKSTESLNVPIVGVVAVRHFLSRPTFSALCHAAL